MKSPRPLVRLSLLLGLIAVGTFFAQAVATGFVGRAAQIDKGAASGIYLASYYLGGLVAIGGVSVFVTLGWETLGGIGLFLVALAVMAGHVGPGI